MTQECATGCGRPTTGSALCHNGHDWCEDTLVREIAEIASIADDLRTAITRQTAITTGNGSKAAETPVPFDDKASRARAVYLAAAWRWTMKIWDKNELLPTGRDGGLAGIGRWLHARINVILDHPDIGELANDIHLHTKRVLKVIDRPEPGIFAGVCSAPVPESKIAPRGECLNWLYAKPGKTVVTCRICSTHHDVTKRRDALREHAENILMTAPEIARAITWLGDNIKADLVRKWASRGRLEQRGTTPEDRPLYRVGDVLTLLAQNAPKEQVKAS